MHDLLTWLQTHRSDLFATLNPGNADSPTDWPSSLRACYALHDGQSEIAIERNLCLHPRAGIWLSVADVRRAHAIWKVQAARFDMDWYRDTYLPIFMDLEGDHQNAIAIDLTTGKIGDIDLELGEFSVLTPDIDQFFADMLQLFRSKDYPEHDTTHYRFLSEEEEDAGRRALAQQIADEHRSLDEQPDAQALMAWAKEIYRKYGDPKFDEPNIYVMRLAVDYLERIPAGLLDKKETQYAMMIRHRYRKIQQGK